MSHIKIQFEKFLIKDKTCVIEYADLFFFSVTLKFICTLCTSSTEKLNLINLATKYFSIFISPDPRIWIEFEYLNRSCDLILCLNFDMHEIC